MSKLQLTDSARVLHAALGPLTFTVDELAKRASTKPATVRTVLFRAKNLVEEVGTVHTGRAGRRSKRYRLIDSARAKLSAELTHLTSQFRSPEVSLETEKDVEAALAAAASSLSFARAESSVGADARWLERARSQLHVAQRLAPDIPDSTHRQEALAKAASLALTLSRMQAQGDPAWQEQARTLAGYFWNAPAAREPLAVLGRELEAPVPSDGAPCLWFDATVGFADAWSKGIAAGLRSAECQTFHFPVRDFVDGDQQYLAELERLITGMPSGALVFLTMRSQESSAGEGAMQLLRGPLRPILHPVGQDLAGPSPTIAVIDHDLNEEAFWIDHGIANLRYYPTAKPNLARVIAERLIKDKTMADPAEPITRMFTPEELLGYPVRPKRLLRTREGSSASDFPVTLAPENQNLSKVAADLGFAALEVYLQRLQNEYSPCLLGVNRGGFLLATLLSKRRGLNDRYLIKCNCDPESGSVLLERDVPLEVSSLIIIDDVVRTGRTMGAVRTYLRDHYPNVAQHAIALAVISSGYLGTGVPYDIDFCPWISRNPKLKFPWSDASEREPDPNRYLDTRGLNQIGGWLTEHTNKGVIGECN